MVGTRANWLTEKAFAPFTFSTATREGPFVSVLGSTGSAGATPIVPAAAKAFVTSTHPADVPFQPNRTAEPFASVRSATTSVFEAAAPMEEVASTVTFETAPVAPSAAPVKRSPHLITVTSFAFANVSLQTKSRLLATPTVPRNCDMSPSSRTNPRRGLAAEVFACTCIHWLAFATTVASMSMPNPST